MNKGEIYCITSPSNKKYIGQCVKFLSNNKKWGYINRWKQHCTDAINGKDYCRLLNNAIRKYGCTTFKIEVIKECNIDELDYYENLYINKFNTLTPNGYNLISGKSNSRQSIETKELRRESMLGKNKGKIYNKRLRKRSVDNILPKYLRFYTDKSGKEGYRISNHPSLSDKSFVSKKLTLEEKLSLAFQYLDIQR